MTVYGVWNEKDGRHWQHEQLDLDCRSSKIKPQLDAITPFLMQCIDENELPYSLKRGAAVLQGGTWFFGGTGITLVSTYKQL